MNPHRPQAPDTTPPDQPQAATSPAGGEDPLAGLRWLRSAEFGPYLITIRERKRVSQRLAAHHLGISHTYLARLERGQLSRPPKLDLLRRIADAMSVPLEEVLVKAGYQEPVTDAPDTRGEIEQSFANLVLHPSLRPALMDRRELDFIPLIVKKQWIDFAVRLERYLAFRVHYPVRSLLLDPEARPALDYEGAEADLPDFDPDGPTQEDPQ